MRDEGVRAARFWGPEPAKEGKKEASGIRLRKGVCLALRRGTGGVEEE